MKRGWTGMRPGISVIRSSPTPTTLCCRRRWRSGLSACSRRCCRAIWRSSMKSTPASWMIWSSPSGRATTPSRPSSPSLKRVTCARCAWATCVSSAPPRWTAWPRSTPSWWRKISSPSMPSCGQRKCATSPTAWLRVAGCWPATRNWPSSTTKWWARSGRCNWTSCAASPSLPTTRPSRSSSWPSSATTRRSLSRSSRRKPVSRSVPRRSSTSR